jgi:hypothetical protein
MKSEEKNKITKENYVTKKEVEKILNNTLSEINKKISDLKEQIDRVYEYVDEIFLFERRNQFPNDEEMRIVYDNLNVKGNFEDSIPIYLFKNELKKKFNITEEELNKKIIELDKREIIYLTASGETEETKKSERYIKSKNGDLFYYITWRKR